MEDVLVGQFGNQAEAEMWAELLRAEGIRTRIVRQGMEIAAVGFDAWTPHDLHVPAQDASRARELLPDAPGESRPPSGE